nr:serine/arginine-rich splicing factor SR45-like [Loxodonta africana]
MCNFGEYESRGFPSGNAALRKRRGTRTRLAGLGPPSSGATALAARREGQELRAPRVEPDGAARRSPSPGPGPEPPCRPRRAPGRAPRGGAGSASFAGARAHFFARTRCGSYHSPSGRRRLVPPRAPRRALADRGLSPASSSGRFRLPGAESPRASSHDNLPSRGRSAPAPALAGWGPPALRPSAERRASFTLNGPPAAQAAAPSASRSPEAISRPAWAAGGDAGGPLRELNGAREASQRGGVRRARPVPSAPHPRQRRRELRRRRMRWCRGRLRGGCSNSIYPLLPPLSPPPRHVDVAHWPRAPSAARAARPRPLPSRGSLPIARLAPTPPRRPRLLRAPPQEPGSRPERAAVPAQCALRPEGRSGMADSAPRRLLSPAAPGPRFSRRRRTQGGRV